MDVADLALSTRVTHGSYIELVVRPVLGDWPVRKLERRVDVLDQLYAHLRRCSRPCDGRPFTVAVL
jgi:integrase